ncbi:MAG: type II toxin-antitoxin system VapC family toxin [Terriglobales bacterium]
MIYFDAAYIAKCYLHEPGGEGVRALAREADGLASCELARLEFAALVSRQRRERNMPEPDYRKTMQEFEQDERGGVWQWLPVTPALIEAARRSLAGLPSSVFLRAGAALHPACAQQNGFAEIYSNDRHLLSAAHHFRLEGVNVVV